ncbi:MAG: Rare lipoprotein [Pseudomonadota bacterium]|jgi:LPS-assembly lipoprotein
MKKLTFLVLFLLSSCGFQLRGTLDIPEYWQPVYISSENADDVTNALKQNFEAADIQQTSDPNQAKLILRTKNQKLTSRILSVSSTSAKTQEREYISDVEFELNDPKGTSILPKQKLTARRELSLDERAVLAKSEEEQLLLNDLNQELAGNIARRLMILRTKK